MTSETLYALQEHIGKIGSGKLINRFYFFIFSLLAVGIMLVEAGHLFSYRVFFTSMIIALISLKGIFSRPTQPYSLEKMFYIFSFFFYGISPLLQFYDRSSFFGSRRLEEQEYFYMNLLIIAILLLYAYCYHLGQKLVLNKHLYRFSQKYSIRPRLNNTQKLALILLSVVSFFMVFYANGFNVVSLLIRGGELKESNVGSKSISLIIFRFFQPLSMVSLYYYILSKTKDKLTLSIISIFTILACFPLAMARFSAAALYIPLLILAMPLFRRQNLFSLFMILGLLVIFPFLNQVRRFATETDLELGFDFSMFTEPHFDSYHNFSLIVSENMITLGRQLLGVILFWVPRSVWPDKPIGSGAFLAEEQGFVFSNVSANFFAEGYVNFGFWGIFLFAVVLGSVSGQLDKLYWTVVEKQSKNFSKIFYLILLGMLFFMLRGDLMSSFAYTLGFIVSIMTAYKVVDIAGRLIFLIPRKDGTNDCRN